MAEKIEQLCRSCGSQNLTLVLDLGTSPPSNAYLSDDKLNQGETWLPLKALLCADCFLVQTQDFAAAEALFDEEYAYFSGFSKTWVSHCKEYHSSLIDRFNLDDSSLVVEVASNDGTLINMFSERGIPSLGIEPTHSTAAAAKKLGLEVVEEFFGEKLATDLARENRFADLTVANNVLAHVPDINDFVKGFEILLKPEGVSVFEFPHVLNMKEKYQFDTIYHEHYSYLSLSALDPLFRRNDLRVFDVIETDVHGGSLRIFACKASATHENTERVAKMIEKETLAGLLDQKSYADYASQCMKIKFELLHFLTRQKNEGKTIMGYGAAAKGNTLINYCGIKADILSVVVDLNPAKQGKYLPGSRIPIMSEQVIRDNKPDYVLILPWNLKTEIMQQLSYIREWGGQFVTAIPELEVS